MSTLTERAPLTESGAATRDGGTRYRARIIESDRQGSSGYYPREVIERDGPTTWPEGTAVFADHPGETERHDRPERSVRDLAGRIDSTPVHEADGLYADVYFYPWAASIVREMADDIGLSIRASGTSEASTDPNIRGPVITSLSEGISVDLVTRAGAGGKLVSLIESARRDPAVTVFTESTSLTPTDLPGSLAEATTDEVRNALNAIVHAGGNREAYVMDHDPDTGTVYVRSYDVNYDPSRAHAYPYTYDAPNATIDWANGVEVRPVTTYVPTSAPTPGAPTDVPAPAGQSIATESEETNMANIQIEESTLASLRSDAERVPTLESERDTAIAERDQLREAAADRARADRAATVIDTQAREAGVTFTALETRGLMHGLPVTKEGDLDEAAFTTAVSEAAAEKAAQAGAGHITGFGQSTATSQVEESADDAVAGAFGRTLPKGA